jgi:FkbM family methyltransferase
MTDAAHRALACWALNEDAHFLFPEGDWYWSKHRGRGHYERELERVLRKAAERPYDLIDAGANFGFWSVLASSKPYGRHRAVAIEASRSNFDLLTRNAQANGDRFEALHRAILDVSGARAKLYGEKHYGLSLRADWHVDGAGRQEEVETITLDDVAERYLADRRHPPIVKIDVEGAEIEAIKGASGLIGEGALIIYEDHGKEPSHRISRFVMARNDLAVWYVGRDFQTERITAVDQLGAIKTKPGLGYNFVAYNPSSPWAEIFAGER